MFVLGNINTGFEVEQEHVVLSDGRVIGGFLTDHGKELFKFQSDGVSKNIVTAKELFEGVISGDSMHLIHDGLDTCSSQEIYDVLIEDDNGKVCFDTKSGLTVVDANRVVHVLNAYKSQKRATLPPPRECPQNVDITKDCPIILEFPNKHYGHIALVERFNDRDYVLAWRKDRRQRSELQALSLHTNRCAAEKVAELAVNMNLEIPKLRRNKPRDVQRAKVYDWEHQFRCEYQQLSNLDEARLLVSTICSDLGISEVKTNFGKNNLVSKSYFSKSNGIVLSPNMLSNHTVIHEVAHYITNRLKRSSESGRPAPHGPEFTGVLLALMIKYMGADIDEAINKADECNVIVDQDVMEKILSKINNHQAGMKTGL